MAANFLWIFYHNGLRRRLMIVWFVFVMFRRPGGESDRGGDGLII